MELILHSIQLDWPVLTPILICSILVVTVAINRYSFYGKNKRDVVQFIPKLQKELAKNNMAGAQNLSIQLGGVIGEVTEEAVRIFSEQKAGFSRSFDIAAALASRKLENHLTVLGTIAVDKSNTETFTIGCFSHCWMSQIGKSATPPLNAGFFCDLLSLFGVLFFTLTKLTLSIILCLAYKTTQLLYHYTLILKVGQKKNCLNR